mgnify:CR=1 FL=1
MMNGKTALVTGASRGIGRAIALRLAREGMNVAIVYAGNTAAAEETAQGVREAGAQANCYACDVADEAAVGALCKRVAAEMGPIYALVNNAGITRFQPFLEATPELFDTVVGTDLRGTYFCAQAAARNMVEKGVRGVIINISSNHALGCWPNATVYAAAKAGLDKLGKNMAMELAPHGIRVVTIAPGYTQLPERKRPDTPEANARFKALTDRIPGGRFAEPWEIGDAVVFLASESAGYITGTTLNIDGGSLLPVLAENTFLK